jgi:predicted TPR repeat methyltransferase
MVCRDCCAGVASVFDAKLADKNLSDYRRRGPSTPTGQLLVALRQARGPSDSLLDVGGGVGVIAHELLDDGIATATLVEASSAYLAAAREESARRGTGERLEIWMGDLVELASDVPPADIVTLDKVVCCYADMDALLAVSAARARRLMGLVYPRDSWWVRVGVVIGNFVWRMRGSEFRSYMHRNAAIHESLHAAGFAARSQSRGWWWVIAVFERRAESA